MLAGEGKAGGGGAAEQDKTTTRRAAASCLTRRDEPSAGLCRSQSLLARLTAADRQTIRFDAMRWELASRARSLALSGSLWSEPSSANAKGHAG